MVAFAASCGGSPTGSPAERAAVRSAAPAPPPLVTTEATLPNGDAEVHLWSRGGNATGPVLVLINGGPGLGHESMDPLQDALATSDRRVITYDQRGVGRSKAPGTAKHVPADYITELEGIRVHTGRDRIHLLGHSFGGMVSLAYLDRHPDRVASVILAHTGVAHPDAMAAGGKLLGERVAALQKEGLIPDPLPGGSCKEKLLAIIPAYLGDPRGRIPEVMRRRSCDDSGRSSVLFDFIAMPYGAGVRSSRVPALVLVGDQEPFGPGASRAAVAALRSSDARLEILPRCGHLGWLECGEPFLAAVRGFLARVE